jgi:hypothetical protein
MKADVYNIKGEVVDAAELKEEIFGIEPNEAVVHQVIVAWLANQRQGTQSAKTRAEVSGGGKNLGVRREPDAPASDRPATPCGVTAAWRSRPNPEIIRSRSTKR